MLQGALVDQLEALRERLKRLGQRPSMQFPRASRDVIEVVGMLERFGPMTEAMYLMMAADGRVLNVEREVLRGALEVLGEGQVRTAHMEAMLDAAARASAVQGASQRLNAVISELRDESIKAEIVVVLCAAVAHADGIVTDEEQKLFDRLAAGLGLGEDRALEILSQLETRFESDPTRSR